MYLDRRADRHLQVDSWAVRQCSFIVGQLGSVQFYVRQVGRGQLDSRNDRDLQLDKKGFAIR